MPHRRILYLAALLLGFVAANHPAPVSADDFPAVKPEELKMTSLPEAPGAPGAPAVILYRQVDREDKMFASNEHVYYRIKILTEAGREFGNVEIPLSHGWIDTSSVRGRTVHTDGTIVSFSGKVFEKTIFKAKGVNYLAKVFTLPDVQVGSVIEYSYNLNYRDNYFFAADWLLSEPLFTKEAKFSIKTYTEHGLAIHWNIPAGLPEGVQPPEPGAGGIVRMESAIGTEVRKALEAKGHRIAPVDRSLFFGGYQGIRIDVDRRVLMGGSESRLDGAAMGY